LPTEPTLQELEEKLAEEEELYAELLEKLDALSTLRAPYDQDDTIERLLGELNQSPALTPPDPSTTNAQGLKGVLRKIVLRAVSEDLGTLHRALDDQRAFHSNLIQFLNRFAETTNRSIAENAEFASTLVSFAQKIDRLADAKDRLYASLGNTRADLLLKEMDKRLETVRVGLGRLGERLGGAETSLSVARAELKGIDGKISGRERPAVPVDPGFEAEHYVAFEERFRGERSSLKEGLTGYVDLFEGLGPVLDLGCGRGEFLELLEAADIPSTGIDGNPEMVAECRARDLTAEVGDAVAHVESVAPGTIGGIFAAQFIEHLPPRTIRKFVDDCFRAIRPGGRVVLETVNPASVTAFVGFYRDLTHEKPLHPETLEFLLRAAGFQDVTIRTASPVSERAKLLRVDATGPGSETTNQNFEKLNAFLFGDQDYAAIATKSLS